MSSADAPPPLPVFQPLWFPQVVYAVSIVMIIFFGLFGTFLALKDSNSTKNMKQFIAATKSSGTLVISFAFFGTTLGTSGIFIFAANVAVQQGGWNQVIAQAVWTAVAPLVVAAGGLYILNTKQDVLSFVHFVRYRFGIITFVLTVIVMLLDMAVVLMQEYLSIAQIFTAIVDPQMLVANPDIMIVVILAAVVAIYTTLGGLRVSLVTDLFQCGLTAILAILMVIYIGVTFKYPLPADRYQSLQLGRGNVVGRNSWASNIQAIFIIFYQEENWQRVWASKNTTVMLLGASIGGLMGGLLAFAAGVAGLLSSWAGLQPLDPQGNLALFTVLENQLSSWGVIIMILLLVSLSESFIDSLQNGMVASITTIFVAIKEEMHHRKGGSNNSNASYTMEMPNEDDYENEKPTYNQKRQANFDLKFWFSNFKRTVGFRVVVILLQFLLVPLALRGFSLVQINYVIGQILTIMFSSQFLGLFISPRYYNQINQLLCWLLAFFAPYIYSYIYLKRAGGTPLDNTPKNVFVYTWNNLINANDYGIFLTILITGILASGFLITLNIFVRVLQGKLNRSNAKEELFVYNAKQYYQKLKIQV